MAKMGRPPKPKDQLLDVPLRIMLSAAQRDLIAECARLDNSEVATWARRILLAAAGRRTAKAKSKA